MESVANQTGLGCSSDVMGPVEGSFVERILRVVLKHRLCIADKKTVPSGGEHSLHSVYI